MHISVRLPRAIYFSKLSSDLKNNISHCIQGISGIQGGTLPEHRLYFLYRPVGIMGYTIAICIAYIATSLEGSCLLG